jgi:serine/threonine protein phosphatase PrpC
MIEFGHGTHAGLRRSRNEDTYYADAALGLFLVVDGMGGHRHGEVASAMARDGMVERIGRGYALVETIHRVNEYLIGHSRGMSEVRPMGTTVAALRVTGRDFEAAWVGDSRIYIQQDDSLRQVSHDHSLVEAMVEKGELQESEVRSHPLRNVLTQALGITAADQLHIGLARGRIESGMRLLLCTDGLTEEVTDARIAQIVARNDLAAQECVDQLMLAALDAGARDNVTAILVRAA